MVSMETEAKFADAWLFAIAYSTNRVCILG